MGRELDRHEEVEMLIEKAGRRRNKDEAHRMLQEAEDIICNELAPCEDTRVLYASLNKAKEAQGVMRSPYGQQKHSGGTRHGT